MAEHAETRTLLFRLGGAIYGCDLSLVREIIPYRRATRLPGAPAYVHGLINLRGTILTVIDLGTRLEAGRPLVVDGSIIIIGVDARQVGFAVSDVMDVAEVRAELDATATATASAATDGHPLDSERLV